MTQPHNPATPSAPPPWWKRLHTALMPDYNRQAAVYWWTMVLLGVAILAHAVSVVAGASEAAWVQVGVGLLAAVVAGIFPVRVPHSKNSFVAGEIFIFLLLLMHGPSAAALAAAGEAAAGSWRTSKRWTSRIVSPAISALAMYTTGTALHATLRALTDQGLDNAGLMVVATMVCALTYFVMTTLLLTSVIRLKRNERLQLSDLFGLFGWVGIAYAGSARWRCCCT